MTRTEVSGVPTLDAEVMQAQAILEGHPHAPAPRSLICLRTQIVLDLRDRLRLLARGSMAVEVELRTDAMGDGGAAVEVRAVSIEATRVTVHDPLVFLRAARNQLRVLAERFRPPRVTQRDTHTAGAHVR